MVVDRVGPFSYYFPILPFLVIVRNHHVLQFMMDLMGALLYSKDILLSYLCFILIFAMLALSLFKNSVTNGDLFTDSFTTFTNALITGFIFISTTENYDIVYDVIDSEYYAESNWLILNTVVIITLFFCIMGMFCWIPLVIDVFEQAFEESKMIHDKKWKMRKTVRSFA